MRRIAEWLAAALAVLLALLAGPRSPAVAFRPVCPLAPAASGPGPGPHTFLPDTAAFDALIARTGAHVLRARFSTRFLAAGPSQAANIARVALRLDGRVVPRGAVFSFNRAVGPYTEANGFGWGRMFVGARSVPAVGGGVCQGASTLYNALLLAGLPVVERHAHAVAVPYVPPGRDATVAERGDLDLRFRNDTPGPIVLWAAALDRRLTVAVYGVRAGPPVRLIDEVLRTTPFRTEVVDRPDVPAGTRFVESPGQPGVLSQTWIEVRRGGVWRRRLLHTDRYLPAPRIIGRGTGPRQ